MAIDFPNSPTNGQTFTVGDTTWTYDGSKWNKNAVTISGPTGPNPLVIQPGTPSATNVLWLDTDATSTNPSVPSSVVDNKGELLVGTAADTVGVVTRSTTNGDMLVVDTSTTSGLRWQGQTNSGRNIVDNGGFDVWQRGTSFSGAAVSPYYGADRWQMYRATGITGATFSRQTSALDRFQYAVRAQRDSGNSSIQPVYVVQSFETIDVRRLHNQVLTLSFYARCGTNYSPTSSVLSFAISTGTGTDGSYAAGLTGLSDLVSASATLTTSFQKFSVTASSVLPTAKTQLAVAFFMNPTGTASTNDWFEITGVQLEVGSVATEFDFKPYSETLRRCQRYYYRAQPGTDAFYGMAQCISTTVSHGLVQFPVPMRISPTALEQSGTAGDYRINANNTGVACTSVPTHLIATFTNGYVAFTTSAALTTGRAYALQSVNLNSFLGWSADLL